MLDLLLKDKEELKNLPAELQEFAADPQVLNKINKIIEDFEFNKEKEEQLRIVIISAVKGETNLYDLPSFIEEKLSLDFDAALDLDDRLYKDLFSGIEDMMESEYAAHKKPASKKNIQPVVREIDVEKAQKEKSEFLTLIDKAVKKFNLSFAPASPFLDKEGIGEVGLKNRFYEIADSFLSGARTKVQFKNSLTKDVASGGFGWEKEKAGEVAEFFASYLRIQDIETKKQKNIETESLPALSRPLPPPVVEKSAAVIPSEARSRTPQPNQPDAISPRAALGRNDMITFQPEEKEAEQLKEKVKEFKAAVPAGDIGKKINEAMQELNLDFPSSELNERLKAVIDARIRNVRTSVQTQEKLVLDVASGGLGLAKMDADRVSLILNKYLDGANKDLFQSKMSEKQEFEKRELVGKEEREKMEKEKEMQNLNARFKKLTGKDVSLPVIPSAVEGSKVSGKEAPPLIVPAPLKPKSILIPPEEKPIFPIKKSPISVIPAASSVIPAASSVIPAEAGIQTGTRPSMDDIKFTPKLYGPLEEIGRMTLDDFRKLSSDPKEVMLKIKDKLGLLRGESFKKYQAGIEAWRKSPVYAEYLKILEQSLTAGLPLAKILAKNKTLTQQEFDAIIEGKMD